MLQRIEAWIRKLIGESESRLSAQLSIIAPPVFDDTHLCEEVHELEFRLREEFHELEKKFTFEKQFNECEARLRLEIEHFGAPIANELDLLRTYEAVTYAVEKIELDHDFKTPQNSYLKVPEAIQWTVYYLKQCGWANPGIPNINKLVELKFKMRQQYAKVRAS